MIGLLSYLVFGIRRLGLIRTPFLVVGKCFRSFVGGFSRSLALGWGTLLLGRCIFFSSIGGCTFLRGSLAALLGLLFETLSEMLIACIKQLSPEHPNLRRLPGFLLQVRCRFPHRWS